MAGLFRSLGTRKLRLTGGEPLLRRGLDELIGQLSELELEMALTTNGVLLPKCAESLRRAGLNRLTVSLDALDSDAFQKACDAPGYGPSDVLSGIEAAQAAGFGTIKVNCVVRRGFNEGQVLALARHFSDQNVVVRFIEYMDVGTRNGWSPGGVVSKGEILALLAQDGAIEALPPRHPGEVARRYRGPHGEFGIIASVSEPFCGDCCRVRLSADGSLYTCLFAHQGTSLMGLLRGGASDADIKARIAQLWRARDDRYSELRGAGIAESTTAAREAESKVHLPTVGRVEMSYIGG